MTTEGIFALLALWVIKPLLIILVILSGALFLRKTSAALQHFWLASGVLAVLVLPLLSPLIPALEWQVIPSVENPDQPAWFAWGYRLLMHLQTRQVFFMVSAVYFLIASWLLFYFFVGLWQLRQQTKNAVDCRDAECQELLHYLCAELGIERRVRLLLSQAVYSPQMWGLWRPTVTLPLNSVAWSSERKLAVLIHELGHVARYDWATTILVKIVCALFWFLPPVWWLAARLDHCAEMACDDFIYRLRDKHLAYAENLLALAQVSPAGSAHTDTLALPMAGHAPVFYRIQAILDRRRPRNPVAPEARQYWTLTLLMLLLPLAALQIMPIRETLLANLLIVQGADEKESRENLEADATINAATDTTEFIDSKQLRRLKYELFINELPRQGLQEVDDLVVTAEWPTQLGELDTAVANLAVDRARPLIRIEGYMPLQTLVPVYPRVALIEGIEGEVSVRFTIEADGSISDAEILHAHPRRVFERTVLNALRQWRYRPQLIDGNPVVLQGVVETFTFQLEPPDSDSRRR